MKKIFVAALGLSLLTTSTALMAQDGGKMDSTSTSTSKKKKKSKKSTMTSTSSVAAR